MTGRPSDFDERFPNWDRDMAVYVAWLKSKTSAELAGSHYLCDHAEGICAVSR